MWRDLLKLWKEDNLLRQAWEQSFEMLKIDQQMFLEALRVFREVTDKKISLEIRKKDKIVNKYEREVRRKVLTHLTVRGPIDLPAGLVLITIIIDIERIGDYSKNILDLANHYPKKFTVGKFDRDLIRIEDAVKDNFVCTQTCVETSDQNAALNLLEKYEWVNKTCDQNANKIVRGKGSKLDGSTLASLVLYFRYLKRINAHLRNVTSSVVNPFDRIGYRYKEEKK